MKSRVYLADAWRIFTAQRRAPRNARRLGTLRNCVHAYRSREALFLLHYIQGIRGNIYKINFRGQNDDKQNSVYVNVRNNFILRISETADESFLHFQFIYTRLQYAHYVVVCYFSIFVNVTEEIEYR